MQDLEEDAAKHRISLVEVDILSLSVVDPRFGSAEDFELLGRLRNRSSRFSLTSMTMIVQLEDCVAPEGPCDVVGEDEVTIRCVIPPGQVRDVQGSLWFAGFRGSSNSVRFTHRITEIAAR
jgi:hypothetical protein